MKGYPKLDHSIDTDVCIIGGGITGAVTAYLLAKAGKRVVLLEKKTLTSGATGKTTGFLTQAVDTDYSDLIKMLGRADARKVYESHGDAIELAQTIVEDEGIECNFSRAPLYYFARDEKEFDRLKKEYESLLSINADVELAPADLLRFSNAGSLMFPEQAKYYGSVYATKVAAAAAKHGARIFENTEAKKIKTEPLLEVKAGRYTITADWIISASYSPFQEPAGLFLKKAMYTSYVQMYEIPAGALPEAMFEDLHNPYHYLRVDKGDKSDSLLVGGEDHRSDIKVPAQKNFRALETFAREIFNDMPMKRKSRWSGPILEPIDGLAFIGPYGHDRTLYAFGFSGSGMTYSHIAAMMFRDEILGIKNPWSELYSPKRIPNATSLVIKGKDYVGELVNGAVKNAFTRKK